MSNISEIISAIVEREQELVQKYTSGQLIERNIFSSGQQYLTKDAALVITGVRRCGKSIFAFMLGKNQQSAYVNFEDERLQLSATELNKVLEAVYMVKGNVDLLIFDEIQNITGWEKFVSRLILTKKVIITGSNARLLSTELATFLTGRHIDIALFPFSFREYLKYHHYTPNIYMTSDVARIKQFLQNYMDEGGFPLRYTVGKLFLLEMYKDVLERDIIQRYNIKQVQIFKELAKYLLSQSGNEITYNRLTHIFAVKSSHTIKNYVSYLQNAYLIFVVDRFSFKLKEQVLAPKKVYGIDTGLVGAVGFTSSENYGKMMENIVAIELFRQKAYEKREVYYWKDYQQHEVDFVIKEGKKVVQLIQVCYDLSSLNTKEREIRSLLKASKELHCYVLLIITLEKEGEEKIEGRRIHYIPLWKWLLTEKV